MAWCKITPMPAAPKKPRRTAERILEVTLELFNRFGEPNVSTTVISAELKISPGNLYYHYPAKDELINSLFGRYEKALDELLRAADDVRNVEDAWLFFHMLFELIWQYRFLYRDLNDLLSKNRKLETHFQFVLKNKGRAVQAVLGGLARGSGDEDRRPRSRARGHRDGGGADLLAELRVRARPAQGARARERRRGAGARRLPCAEPADALPGAGRARPPALAGGALPAKLKQPNNEETRRWPNGPPSPTSCTAFDAAKVKKQWARLHAGDAEPLPKDAKVLDAWALFHAGEFQKAFDAGPEGGRARGITVANKAQSIYANYLEKSEKTKLAMFQEVMSRAEAQAADEPKNPNAHYWLAYAIGRYSQGISVAKALSQGLGTKVKHALETTIKLAPKHADAHIALGAFHAEVIDKVGSLLGKTQGANKATGLAMFQQALKLKPAQRDRDDRVRQRPGDARRRQEDEGGREAVCRRRGLHAGRCDGAARRGDGQGRAGRLSAHARRLRARQPGAGRHAGAGCAVHRGAHRSAGAARGAASVAGVAAGNLGSAMGASLGLAALFAVSATAFGIVKWAGAAYLIWLGVQALRRPPTAGPPRRASSRRGWRASGATVSSWPCSTRRPPCSSPPSCPSSSTRPRRAAPQAVLLGACSCSSRH